MPGRFACSWKKCKGGHKEGETPAFKSYPFFPAVSSRFPGRSRDSGETAKGKYNPGTEGTEVRKIKKIGHQ